MATDPNVNWCKVLKEYADAKHVSYHYEVDSTGPCHDTTFRANVKLGTFTTEGTGKTKRAAKDEAAQLLMNVLDPQSVFYTRKVNFVGKLQVSDRVTFHIVL